ncbi:hypothetical protein CDL15_Pgr027402 [Punica granatum]|uniref:Core domain-containing protein n=1 Tax=Punica granatum TaxID=22663 RepID=A0A218Y0S3_PUNGR|nr:hypothetical protein CDL15_Pgr027402 [Punica granatum]
MLRSSPSAILGGSRDRQFREESVNKDLHIVVSKVRVGSSEDEVCRNLIDDGACESVELSHGLVEKLLHRFRDDWKSALDEKGKFDELTEDKGVKILIDPKALMHVIGTKMDFVDDKLRSEFIFINPNSKGQCGCGESFMTTNRSGAAKRGGS